MTQPKVFCHKHTEQELICPICRGSKGGKTTAKKYSSRTLSKWGKLGGRPRGSKDSQPRKRKEEEPIENEPQTT